MQRSCFRMRVAAEHLIHYERMHREAWPELLDALHDSGWRNYSLFLRDDGLLVGYAESRDWPNARQLMDAEPVSARWSAEMDRLVVPGTSMVWLELVDAAGPALPLGTDATRRIHLAAEIDTGDPSVRFACFQGDPPVTYMELPAAHPRANEASAFRRIFDLEQQRLAARERKEHD